MPPILKIITYTRRFWLWYLLMAIFVIAVSLLSLASPLFSKQIVDLIVSKVIGTGANTQKLFWLLGAIIAVDLLSSLLTAIGQQIGDIVSVRLQSYLSSTFYQHILGLHVGYYDNEITGKIINKMYRGITSISEFIQDAFNNFLPFFLTALVTIILLAHYSLFISLLLFILFPVYILISRQSSVAWEKHEAQKNQRNDLSQGRVFESLTGIRIVKSFVAEVRELQQFISTRKEIETISVRQTRDWHIIDFLRRVFLNLILFAIYAYVVFWTFNGHFTIGEMTLLIQLVNQARFPLFAMSFILGQIQQANAGSADFFKVLEIEPQVQDLPNASVLKIKPSPKPVIEFSHVTFGYDPPEPVLNDISFALHSGQQLALVAESGQGKSTIVNLLLRYYEPQAGDIFINGQNIQKVTQTSLHRNISVVFQESLLFSGTIRENIAYGRPGASLQDIETAAKAANAHDFIMKLPQQYNSLVGERGVKLSGGQKQRIAIARAILKDAPIVILDEATSSLDSRAELQVQKGLNELMKNKTSIVIAHRLSTIANADLVLAIEEGRITQFGPPRRLLKNPNGLYAKLIKLQRHLLRAPANPKISRELQQFDIVG
ncbi:ABC transporter ATP-binding protein/permease [Patescibacteria group bacterium]|nr:ABC transporter ATP-binding protein/permease [Patescibacteria group bacterium]